MATALIKRGLDGRLNSRDPLALRDLPVANDSVSVPAKFHPDRGDQFIVNSYPTTAVPGVDVNYQLVGYHWDNGSFEWSLIDAPSGLTVSTDGLMSWVPTIGQDNQTYNYTIRLTIDGVMVVDKPATTRVNSARATYVDWANGVDSAGRGTALQPYQSVRYAIQQDVVGGSGRIIYVRGGTSHEAFLYASSSAATYPSYGMIFDDDDLLIIRSYPGETVLNDCLNAGGSYCAAAENSVLYDLHAINTGSTGTGMQVNTNAVAVMCSSFGNNYQGQNNPSSLRLLAGGTAARCTLGDSYDRSSSGTNSQGILVWGDIHIGVNKSLGDTLLIDCVFEGAVDNAETLVGARAKHPSTWVDAVYGGEYKVVMHRCAVINPNTSYGAINLNGNDSFRHGLIYAKKSAYTSSATQQEHGRPSAAAMTQAVTGLSQANLIILRGQSGPSSIGGYVNQYLFYDDLFVLDETVNALRLGTSSATNDAYAGFDFKGNTFYADADSWVAPSVLGTSYALSDINEAPADSNDRVGGSNNTREPIPASLHFTCANKTWSYDTASGVLS